MGTVFLAEQIALGNRPVALKILLRKLLDDPEFLQRFRNEAAATARIHHPNVITIHEFGQADDGSPYIAMEYLEGESLRQTLQRRGAIPIAEVVEIVRQIARGLGAAHKLDIIHRDLKPDNIFLARTDDTGEGTALPGVTIKIMDFGIARLRESSLTLTGTVLGTPAYMSFEQASGMRSEDLDARSDIYALGVVVYEMLTGRVPFHSDTPLGYVRKHMLEEPPPFHSTAPSALISPEIEHIVMKALRKAREERQSSALEFARELAVAAQDATLIRAPETLPSAIISPQAAAVAPAPASARPAPSLLRRESETTVLTPPPAPPKYQPESPRFEPPVPVPAGKRPGTGMLAALGLLLVLLIGGGVWYFSQNAKKPVDYDALAKKYGGASEPQAAQSPEKVAPAPSPAPVPSAIPPGMVWIPGGTFTMGRNNGPDAEERPAHSIVIQPFYLDLAPRKTINDLPFTGISWHEAQQACQTDGKRLPTEAEWEYAARGTDGRLYPWGNTFDSSATNSKESGKRGLIVVGSLAKDKSPFGVLDMSGNVWEWTADDYKPYPGGKATFRIPADAKVIRGGSYKSDKLHVTATTRNLEHASTQSPVIGFRCAK